MKEKFPKRKSMGSILKATKLRLKLRFLRYTLKSIHETNPINTPHARQPGSYREQSLDGRILTNLIAF